MKKILVVFILLSQLVSAQKHELDKVTVEELKQKVHPKDSTASAAILFKKGETKFFLDNDGRWEIQTEVDVKIKVYKKDGLKYGNFELPLYTGGITNERVDFSKAVTYNLVDGKVEKTKLKSEGEFVEVVNEKWKHKKIVMPAVREGSIVEFRYFFRSPYYSNFNDWYFQTSIPVDYVHYEVTIPKYFNYNTLITGFEDVKQESKPLGASKYGEMVHEFYLENVPAIREEEYVNNINNYTSVLKFELASIQYPGQDQINYASDWVGVTKTIYDNDQFGKELKRKNYFEADLDPVIAAATGDTDKMEKIFRFVQDRMNWNERTGYLCSQGVKKAFADKVGNSAEINLMLVAMLRYAGINANPILLSTRSNGISVFPNVTAYNYVIAGVEIENHVILLDATSKYSNPDVIPLRALNWAGRIIRKNESSADINLNRTFISKEQVNATMELDGTGKLNGSVRKQYSEYNALNYRENYMRLSKETIVERIEKKNEGLTLSEYTVANEKEMNKPVVENYKVSLSNTSEIVADRLLFSPLVMFNIGKNPFVEETRKYPVDVNFPFKDSYNVSIRIPDGYVVESTPKPIRLLMDNDLAEYTYNIANKNNTIQIVCSFSINTPLIPAEYYGLLKSFFDEVVRSQSEKIVLKKA